MSNIAELKQSVKDILHLSLDVTDKFQGEASTDDVETILEARLLRAANNARLWAERRHDFAENDMAVRVAYEADYPCPMAGMDNSLVANRMDSFYAIDKLIISTGAGVGRFRSYGASVANASTVTLQEFGDKLVTATGTVTVDEAGHVLCTSTGLTDGTYSNWAYLKGTIASLESYGRIYKLRTLQNAFKVESEGIRPLWIKSRKNMINRSRMQLDLEEADPYIRYPDDDPAETRPIYLVYDGVKFRVMPEQSVSVVLEGTRWMDTYVDDQDTDFLLQDAFDFMMWATVVEMNFLTQTFGRARQEGWLDPPVRMRDEAWQALVENDEYRFDGSVIHDL
jgi:hypothetical protein